MIWFIFWNSFNLSLNLYKIEINKSVKISLISTIQRSSIKALSYYLLIEYVKLPDKPLFFANSERY